MFLTKLLHDNCFLYTKNILRILYILSLTEHKNVYFAKCAIHVGKILN
jgi:hypothetical protein